MYQYVQIVELLTLKPMPHSNSFQKTHALTKFQPTQTPKHSFN